MRKSKVRIKRALTVIASKRWVDGSVIDNVRYVWPHEGTWIVSEMYAISGHWVQDTDELFPEYIGAEPTLPRGGEYGEKYCRWRELEIFNHRRELCSYIRFERLCLIPDGTIILERYFDEGAVLRQEIVISTSEGNPQPYFNFEEPARILTLWPLAKAA